MIAALRNRRFTAYLLTAACADGGYWIATIAQSWLVLTLTDSALWLGLVAGVGQLPYLLFSLVGGSLADRFDRRAIIAINNTGIAIISLVTAALVFTHTITIVYLLVLSFALGTIFAIEQPVDRAWLYDLVDRKLLDTSIALSSLEWAVARTVGPALGGAVVALIGIAAGYVAFAALVVPITVLALVLANRHAHAPQATPADDRKGDANRERAIVIFSAFIATFSIGVTPYITLLPEIAKHAFGADARGYGAMAAAGGIGAICAAVTLALAGDLRHRGRITTICAFVGALLLVVFTRAHRFDVALVLLAAMGAVDTLMYALANTYVQAIASAERRGWANAVFSLAFLGGMPIGSVILGTFAQRYGSQPTLAVSGTLAALAAIGFWAFARTARDAA